MPSIQPIVETDIPAVLELMHHSKLSLTINRLLWEHWPAYEIQKKPTLNAITSSFHDPDVMTLKAVADDDDDKGKALGYMVLSPRKASPKKGAEAEAEAKAREAAAQDPANWPQGVNPGVMSMVMRTITEIESHRPDTDYIEVTFIVVQQAHRRQGIGRLLMAEAFKHATSAKLPLFFTTEPAARDFFLDLGMREVTYVDMDLAEHAPPHTGFGLFRLTGLVWMPSGLLS